MDMECGAPDAELIHICAEFDRLELRNAHPHNTPAYDDDSEVDSTISISVRQGALLDRMGQLRATTAEGIQARARTLARHNGDFAYNFDDRHSWAGRQLDYLLRDAATIDAEARSSLRDIDSALSVLGNRPRIAEAIRLTLRSRVRHRGDAMKAVPMIVDAVLLDSDDALEDDCPEISLVWLAARLLAGMVVDADDTQAVDSLAGELSGVVAHELCKRAINAPAWRTR